MTRGTAGRALALVLLACGWAAASWALWQSRVPGTLKLPKLDQHDYFTAAQLHAADSFSRIAVLLWAAGVVVQVVALVLYAWQGKRFARESAAGPIGTGMLLGMLGFAILWLAEVPVSVLELWWQRRHQLSHLGYVAYVVGNWLALAGEFAFLCLALLIVMGFARVLGERWWLAAAPVFVGLALLFAFVFPYLTPTHRLDDPQLRSAAARFEKLEHVENTPVVVQDVRDVTSLPNAEAMGVGPSTRVVLWDTLVDGPYTTRELQVVIAHELGHLSRNHIWKAVGWYALFAFPGAYLIARIVRRRGGMARPEAVPLSLLVLVVLGLLASPIDNLISRHLEQEADWMSLITTRDPAAAKQLFRSFGPATLSEPNPSTFEYVALETHPTIMQRIAMAEAYATSAAQSP